MRPRRGTERDERENRREFGVQTINLAVPGALLLDEGDDSGKGNFYSRWRTFRRLGQYIPWG
jgi:hypothetical protein